MGRGSSLPSETLVCFLLIYHRILNEFLDFQFHNGGEGAHQWKTNLGNNI